MFAGRTRDGGTVVRSSRSDAPFDILVVEDNPGDVRLIEEAFEGAEFDTALHVVTDGDEAMDILSGRTGNEPNLYPNLVLLDLSLPRMSGFEVLDAIKEDPELAHLPVVVLSSSGDAADVVESYDRHANAYLTKPTDPDEFVSMVESLEEFWFEWVRLPPVSG